MAAGATKQYNAVFAIGAKLLGSFSGAMSAAQQRMSRLQAATARIGAGMKRMAMMFSGLFAGLAAFAGYQIFQKIFAGAEEAAQKAHDRTRKLIGGLMGLNAIAKKGRPEAEKQAKLLQESNELLAKQQLYSSGILDTGAARLAMMKIPPKYIKQAMGPMADLLALEKGAAATSEDMNDLAFAFGKAVNTGMMRPLQRFGIILSKPEQAFVTQLAKAGETQKVYDFLLKRMSKYAGESARLLKTPEGRIAKLGMDMAAMSKRIGLAMEPARAELADAWREILPAVEPILLDIQKAGVQSLIKLVKFIKSTLIPAFQTLSKWWRSEGGKAFAEMWSKIGAAFKNMIGGAKDSKKSFAEIIQEKLISFLDAVAKAFKWIGDNAYWLVPVVTQLGILLAAIAAIGFISTNIYVIGAAAAIAAIGLVIGEYKKYLALLNGEQVSDPDHFTKHWYLLNQTWTEVFAGLQGSWEELKSIWNGVVDYIKWVWQSFIDKINIFKPPKWWTDFWKDQTEEAKKHYEATQGLRDADDASAAEQAKLQQAYIEKYGSGITRTPTAVEQSAAVGAAKEAAPMLARPAYDLRIPALHKSLLPAIAQPMQEHAILPLEGMEKTVLSVSQTFDAMFGDLQTQVNPAITEAGFAISETLTPAVADVAMQFAVLSDTLAGITGLGGAGGGGGGFGGGGFGGGAAGAAALAPIGAATANLPMSPEAMANISAERSEFIKELQKPELQNLVSATLSTEMQSAEGQKDVLESLVNRAVAYKRAGKYQGMEHMIKGGFYGPYNRGVTNAVMRSGLSPERQAQVAEMIEETKTRNVLQGMTDQGVNVGPRRYVHGEGYSYAHGVATAAYQGAKEAADAAPKLQAGGIVKKPTMAQIGEHGPEAVVPLSKLAMLGGFAKRHLPAWAGEYVDAIPQGFKDFQGTRTAMPFSELSPDRPTLLHGLLGLGEKAMEGAQHTDQSSTTMHFSPNVTIHGNADEAAQKALIEKLSDMSRGFIDNFKRAQHQERRLSYEGGYG